MTRTTCTLAAWAALAALVPSGRVAAQVELPALFPSGYLDAQGLAGELKRLEGQHPKLVRVAMLAKSRGGRGVPIVILGRAPEPDEGPRPAILLVANLEADHVAGGPILVGVLRRLAEAEATDPEVAGLLKRCTVFAVPRLNPDGSERLLVGGPRAETRLNLAPIDRDRDGKSGEDGPDDLDGDGLALTMRVADGRASLVPDDKDPRILRKADRAKGERPAYSVYVEGIDNDGDGLLNEDPPGGVDLNRHWPHAWAEFDPEAGWSPASEPEARALIQFVFDHPEIAVAWALGRPDNLQAEPKKPGSTLDDADLALFAELSRLYQKATRPPKPPAPAEGAARPAEAPAGRKPAPPRPARTTPADFPTPAAERAATAPAPLEGGTDGAFHEWAYHQFGAIGLGSRPWPGGPTIPAPAATAPPVPPEGEARWLYWNDHVMGGRAFVPWRAFDHPSLGPVELGGWKPGVRVNPPAGQVEAIAEAHFAFLKDLARRLPRLAFGDITIEAKGGGLVEIKAVVVNEGTFPTALAQGVRTRKAPPVLVRMDVGGAKLVAGKALERIDALAGAGGRKEFRWLVLAPETVKAVTLEASCPKAGRVRKAIPLEAPR